MLWFKAAHLIAVVAWFAGLLYLPRLFVYHAAANKDNDEPGQQRFTTMERRLFWRIMTPAMVAALFFGLTLMGYGFRGGWLWAKLALVAALLCFHASTFYYHKKLQTNSHPSEKFFRIYNEIPAVFLVAIVILAIVKPF